jgi:hypothetical protein
VLPYVSNFHKWGSSGKLFDALLFNCRTLVPSESALSTLEINGSEKVRFNVENAETEIYENLLKFSINNKKEGVNFNVPRVDNTVDFIFKELEKLEGPNKATKLRRLALEKDFWLLSFLYLLKRYIKNSANIILITKLN